ncbi:MAG: hypothetical protein ACKN9E_17970 [Microcystaceae cyanobacterium]
MYYIYKTISNDKIEVGVTDLDIPFGVILVDLPGLAVSNKRHIEFTKTYIKKEAKAFVVCGKPDHLFEGEEIELLEEINRNNSKILQRSFWVINKWDTVTSKQKEEVEKICEEKQKHFLIKSQRLFKLSALRYFLAQFLIEKGNLEETVSLKDHANDILPPNLKNVNGKFDIDKVKNYLAITLEVKAFSEFRMALFENLRNTAIDEFIADAKRELSDMTNLLVKFLPSISIDSKPEDIKNKILRTKIREDSKAFFDELNMIIKEVYGYLSISETNKLWNESHQTYIEDCINKIFSPTNLNVENIKKELEPEYLHTDRNFARLPKVIDDKIQNQLSDVLKESFTDAVKDVFSKMNKLFFKIKEIKPEYFPQETLEKLEYQLGHEQMTMRLLGNMDVLFLDYGSTIQSVALESLSEYQSLSDEANETGTQNQINDQQIKLALTIYCEGLRNFIADLGGKIDQALKRSVKNHGKTLQGNLEKLVKEQEHLIADLIDEQISRQFDKSISDQIEYEMKKQTAIAEANTNLKSLKKII